MLVVREVCFILLNYMTIPSEGICTTMFPGLQLRHDFLDHHIDQDHPFTGSGPRHTCSSSYRDDGHKHIKLKFPSPTTPEATRSLVGSNNKIQNDNTS